MNRITKRVAIGTMIAGAMGYLAGILTAPKSGGETRKTLRQAPSTARVEAEKQLKRLHTELTELLGEARNTGKKMTDKARQAKEGPAGDRVRAIEGEVVTKATRAKQKTREILSAIHDGSANDKDLDKAVSEASKALGSLRKYLKK